MTMVKICGITDVTHAIQAVETGADAVGFVFAESKRKISVAEAASIAHVLPTSVKKIGVFVNMPKQELENTAQIVGLDYVQLHGDETLKFCKSLAVPYIKAMRVKSEEDLSLASIYEDAAYILLDSASGPYRGGNGTRFNWDLLKNRYIDRSRLILAGGLTIRNVKEAISTVKPAMVDVSSGVETNGIKDGEKIKQFIKQVKEKVS